MNEPRPYGRIKAHKLCTFDRLIRERLGLPVRVWGKSPRLSDEVISEADRVFARAIVLNAWGEGCSDSIDDLEEVFALLMACARNAVDASRETPVRATPRM